MRSRHDAQFDDPMHADLGVSPARLCTSLRLLVRLLQLAVRRWQIAAGALTLKVR
jgi:hypothetical protein